MSATRAPFDLNCTLAPYLEEASRIDTAGGSALAATMLVDLVFVNKNQVNYSSAA